ncbi:MAG: hypothetical protein ABI685_11915 [Ferruginibacter sp.]
MNIPQIELTAVFVTDSKKKGFTAFFAQVPHIIAEGKTLEEATGNLFATLKLAFKYEKTEKFEEGDRCMNTEVITKTFNLAIN